MLTNCPSLPEKHAALLTQQKGIFFCSFFCVLSANHPIQSGMSAGAGWAHPAPVVHYLVQNLKKGNQAQPDSPAACHPPKDDVTEWKQGHDLNMSEWVKEEFNSIYRSNSGARLLSRTLTSGKMESGRFLDWKYMFFFFFSFFPGCVQCET